VCRIEPVDIIGVAVETRFFPFSDHVVVTFLPADKRGTLLGHGDVQFLSHGVTEMCILSTSFQIVNKYGKSSSIRKKKINYVIKNWVRFNKIVLYGDVCNVTFSFITID